jgi:glycosyltransferase involved in cell wall biosynthesis
LQTQLSKSGVDYEIILADDASSDGSIREHNGLLAKLENVTYIQHERNFGRSASRNELADEAQYPFLLFIDCDARVKKECYIAHYLHFISLKKDHIPEFAVSGGLSYRDDLPEKSKHLRYKYGIKREVRSAKERSEHPYSHFTPFNLLITKSVFEKCRFDESLTDYGYEDTFFGLDLEEAEIPLYHIDNELYHDGLDDNRDFLRKIEASVGNLARFYRDGLVDNRFREQSRLLQTWEHLRAKRNGKAIFKALHWMKRPLTNLILRHNSLKALDLYKLMLFDGFVDL